MGYDCVALLTDYGRRDGFVAACHGVIARVAPTVRIIDVTHDVPPQDVRHGAAVLAQTVPYLPSAVIVGVVDPGVGTSRRGVAIAAGDSMLVGPDNGLLLWAANALGGVRNAVSLVAREYHLPERAGTFDGRDVFAAVAAHLARGTALVDLGPPVNDLVALPPLVVTISEGRVETEVLMVDHFGNVQLAAKGADLDAAGLTGVARVVCESRTFDITVGRTFADVAPGELVMYVDGARHIALAVNQGNAAVVLGLQPGVAVTLAQP